MPNQEIDNYRIISTNQLVRAIKEGIENSERFCFILGSGASVSSGIPSGGALEYCWMSEMDQNPGFDEIRETAARLKKENHLDNDFDKIIEVRKWWQIKRGILFVRLVLMQRCWLSETHYIRTRLVRMKPRNI